MNSIRIILADDHAVLRAGLRSFFEEQKNPAIQVVAEASNGEQAVELVEKMRPDILVLDLSMPGMGGLETTLELKKRGSNTRILILTQFAEAIYLRRLLEAGAKGYVLKSARGEELISALRAVMNGGMYIDPSLATSFISGAIGGATEPDASLSGAEEAYSKLTPRERQILKLLAEGYANKEIATSLNLAVKTVMAHRVNLMDKLGIHNRSKLIQFAIKVGLIQITK
ncbi:MAG TPA: DNA-binding response regulator [Bdellovibrionales bacterium]|nr:MAG: DNA-binding response regulator [Bdellovibrionales bacterium GWB1_52_6]OFZ05770.1 MAG: DNA-binding response regulator [Bdellovibrionales bacterium GWA1_52_35]OFZ43700.1 MAG: DNA-binding response regulator [Bdellovibrionales bacterium GWC1_52_8]HAR42185.1 DNA-binding response regulator [Bdellovibrionales bacterium]HCM40289.1 DNA-binding response regulator [Bdellovibrionales bacterium]